MKRHVNIPIFIPHLGCPNNCVFCNQRTISGTVDFNSDEVTDIIETALSTISETDEVEIAFFGGSFTGIDKELMIKLLQIVKVYIDDGRVDSIRCSTRPDYINDEILIILKQYGVKVIELGLQSSVDKVLLASKRGHTALDEEKACKLIKQYGFTLVGQMMIGLPESTLDDELATADFIISVGADAARIYPTVVLYGTELSSMLDLGVYLPLTLDDAVERSSRVLSRFIDAGIDVIRIGLQASDNLTDPERYHAGPNHAALGELVESRLYYNKMRCMLSDKSVSGIVTVLVPRGSVSKAVGHKKENKIRLIDEFGLTDIVFRESDEIPPYELIIN